LEYLFSLSHCSLHVDECLINLSPALKFKLLDNASEWAVFLVGVTVSFYGCFQIRETLFLEKFVKETQNVVSALPVYNTGTYHRVYINFYIIYPGTDIPGKANDNCQCCRSGMSFWGSYMSFFNILDINLTLEFPSCKC
jgi:hypothetical protein